MAFGLSSLFKRFNSDAQEANDSIVGIDIGSSSIKIVQVRDVKGKPTLVTYGELQLGPYEGIDIGRSTHLSIQKAIESLVDILRESGVTTKNIAYTLSYGSSFTTTADIPTLDPERIASMVPVEARKYIPISLSKVELEWLPLGQDEVKKTTHVLMVAVYTEVKERYEIIMSGANLNILGREIEIFSAVRGIDTSEKKSVAVLDCGASSTRLFIARNGLVVKTHSVLLSGVGITEALAKDLGVEFKSAEELKFTFGIYGKESDPRIQKIILSGVDRGLRELLTVIKRYEEETGDVVGRVILSGGTAIMKGFSQYVQDMFTRPVEVIDPFTKIEHPVFLNDLLKETGTSFAIAIGAALSFYEKR